MSLRDIADAANDLATLLESTVQKGLKHPAHSRHVAPGRRKIEALFRRFWTRQSDALLREVHPHIQAALDAAPIREAITPQGKQVASSIMPSSLQPLRFTLTTAEVSEYEDAIASVIAGAAKSLKESGALDLVDDVARRYLRENSLSKLTGGVNATTVDRLQDAIATAWDKGGSYDQIVSAITDTFEVFDTARAGLIAATETADAYSAARQSMASDLGYDEKAWETESGDPCPICEANEAQGYIDIDEDFDSGDDAPTAHPNCLCVVNFRRSSNEE